MRTVVMLRAAYLLHLGRFPTPSVAPPGGNPESEVLVKWLGDPAGDFESKIKIPKEFPRASSEINKLLAVHPQRDGSSQQRQSHLE